MPKKSKKNQAAKGRELNHSAVNPGVDLPALHGWLEKQSGGLTKRWQPRFFEISGHYLRYYDEGTVAPSDDSAVVKGAFDLDRLGAVELGDGVLKVRFEHQQRESELLLRATRGSAGGSPESAGLDAWLEELDRFTDPGGGKAAAAARQNSQENAGLAGQASPAKRASVKGRDLVGSARDGAGQEAAISGWLKKKAQTGVIKKTSASGSITGP